MKICVIGLGYIGLPTSAMFACNGHQVLGVDVNPRTVEALNQGEILIEEPGLAELVRRSVEEGSLRAGAVPRAADVFIIAVPTPITAEKGADMSYVKAATESIVPYLSAGNLVILESTSPVGTVEELMLPILARSGLMPGRDLFVGHSPERVIPGQILRELVENSRIAGGVNQESARRIAELYRCFVKGEIHETTAATAELCKLAENTYRDVNIAFANELAKICESLGVNVWEVIRLCNKHPRVNIHQPGPGVGGHCIAVDPWFIAEKRPQLARIIRLSRETNDSMPLYVLGRIEGILDGINSPRICVLGVTYKPDVDDLRESPILELIELLKARGLETRAYDPFVKGRPEISNDLMEAASGSDLLVLGVHHREFARLPFPRLAAVMRTPQLLDTRNFAAAEEAEAAGFRCWL
ncbi:MAG: nucleotide sugar dehydrogenase, partial [Bacillota bacterium]|nr:nucleotide sugar dehydrogenase [Bacillota bacterium]